MRGNLILLELLVMVLVFALAAAACLGIFAEARLMAEETARLDEAVTLARNAAELLKAGQAPVQPDSGELMLRITPLPSEFIGLSQWEITVFHGENQIFSMKTAGQEVLP